jgi:NAD-dependent protein deacetylase/lipoamidase
MEDLITQGARLISGARQILIFSGAGLSTESGIPDFRSPGGVWDKYDPSDFYFQKFIASEEAGEKYWIMSTEFYATMKDAQPNRAHLAIRELEDMGKLLAIVTQNIDHLHHKAGNSPEKILEIHGTAFSVYCLSCSKTYDRDEIQERLKAGLKVPYCDECSGILKPATVSFGQSMPEFEMAESFRNAQQCDLCIVLGSSLVVYPAASVPAYAKDSGAALMIINRDATPLDSKADLAIHDSAGKVMAAIMDRLETL